MQRQFFESHDLNLYSKVMLFADLWLLGQGKRKLWSDIFGHRIIKNVQ